MSPQDMLKTAIKNYIFDGILLCFLGVVLLVFPKVSLWIICILIGLVLVIMGLLKGIFYILNDAEARHWQEIPVALIQLGLGLALIIKADFFIGLFQIVIGVILICGAVLMFLHAFELRYIRGAMYIMSLIFGSLTMILGVIIVMNPVPFASFIMQLMGVALVVEGIALIAVMRSIKKTAKNAEASLAQREIVVVPERVESVIIEEVEAEVKASE